MEDLPDNIDEQTLLEIGIAQGVIEPEGKNIQAAVDDYLSYVASNNIHNTVGTYRSQLEDLVVWSKKRGIESTAELGPKDLEEFYEWRRQHRDLNSSSLQLYQRAVKRFIRYCCQRNNWARHGLHESVSVPDIDNHDTSEDKIIPHEVTRSIIDHLDKYEPYRCEHVVWTLLGEAGLGTVSLRSLDVDDYLMLEEGYFLRLRHRPDTGTRLRNEKSSERVIQISSYAASVVDEYLTGRRNDVKDEYGREPLLAPGPGRISESTIQKYVYRWSQPCQYDNECPHDDRTPETCTAAGSNEKAVNCPSTEGPQAVRKGYIVQMQREGFENDAIQHRCDVTERVVDDHYDNANELEKAQAYYNGSRRSVSDALGSDSPPSSAPSEQ